MKIIILFFSFIFTPFLFSQVDSIALQLAGAERLFSALSEKEGIKNSFLTYLDDECIMFNPHAVNGKELYSQRPANPAFLSWFPSFVEVAASGDFGISTGPWEYKKNKNDTSVSAGYFFSVWQKKYNVGWKVILDFGISIPQDKMETEKINIHSLPRKTKRVLYPESAQADLMNAEKKFINDVQKTGFVNTYNKYIADNVRIYREGNFPVIEKKRSLALINNDPSSLHFEPIDGRIAFSGDLGFVYGYAITEQSDSCSYVRVWRKEKEWKIAVDILKRFKN